MLSCGRISIASFVRASALSLVMLVVVSACKTTVAPTSLDPTDLEPYKPKGDEPPQVFDRNNVLDDASFVDFSQATTPVVQQYLERTPYARPSFLGTYQSSGLRASDALVNSARIYRINPIVLLVFAQIRAGLVSLSIYPADPARAEYAFQCGCEAKGTCEPRLAGFDKQIECLALRLRQALESVKLTGVTPSGYGPNRTTFTVDGARVTPANAATAAIYDALPREARDAAGGTWLFRNLWLKYTTAFQYSGPFEPTAEGGGIGDACQIDRQCALPANERVCATNYPGGLCTTNCLGECPVVPGKAEGYCVDFRSQGGYCLAICNPSAPNCRTGFACTRVVKFGAPKESAFTCYPQ